MFPGKYESELEHKSFLPEYLGILFNLMMWVYLLKNMLGFYQNKISDFPDFLFQSGISHKQQGYAERAILFLNMLSLMSV